LKAERRKALIRYSQVVDRLGLDNNYMKLLDFYKQNIVAFWTSLIYVVLGGIVACSLYPRDLLSGDWWFFGWLITFPVNFISCSYRMFVATDYYPVIIIQIIVFIPTFIILTRFIPKRQKK
jgi:hypothetical protein